MVTKFQINIFTRKKVIEVFSRGAPPRGAEGLVLFYVNVPLLFSVAVWHG
jgi:hypothetical protein